MKNYIFLIALVALISPSCRLIGGKRIKGDGNIKTETRSVSNFKNVEVHGAIEVYVTQADAASVKLEADGNLLSYLEVIQEGERIIIRTKRGYNIDATGDIKAYITSPVFRKIDVSGACSIIGQTKIASSDGLELEVSGAGDINMEVDAPSVNASVTGSGSVMLKGKTKTFTLELSGAGKAKCFDLLSETTKVDISGAGEADVFASLKLDAEVSGAGNISYKGGAGTVNQRVTGAGNVNKAD